MTTSWAPEKLQGGVRPRFVFLLCVTATMYCQFKILFGSQHKLRSLMWLVLRSCREAGTECHVMLLVNQSKEHVIEIDVVKKVTEENRCFINAKPSPRSNMYEITLVNVQSKPTTCIACAWSETTLSKCTPWHKLKCHKTTKRHHHARRWVQQPTRSLFLNSQKDIITRHRSPIAKMPSRSAAILTGTVQAACER